MQSEAIADYQEECRKKYKESIGYPADYTYLTGNPISPLVPLETATNGVMIIGAYPTARFFSHQGVKDTPLEDIIAPFSDETYMDGNRPRPVLSGIELNDFILSNIGVDRQECWITNLVKVFLFKDGHIRRYEKLGRRGMAENRNAFMEYAGRSLPWIEMEVGLANPFAVITLGAEVTSVILGTSKGGATAYLDGTARERVIGNQKVNVISLPHPGILMKKTEKNPWIERFNNEIAPKTKEEIARLRVSSR